MRWAFVWLACGLIGCGGDIHQCASSAECGGREVCLPASSAPGAEAFCGRIDDSCPTGLRWSESASEPLASRCVSFATTPDAAVSDAPADAAGGADTGDAPVEVNTCGPDGTECMPTTDPCKLPGRCMAGACGAITNAPDGTKCGDASNACHTERVCKGGTCQAEGTHADGYNYQSGNYLARCCGGTPTTINTPNNCGACGIHCASGECINTGATNAQQWWCRCTANSQCFSNCCANGSPSVCSPSTCGSSASCTSCPGGATCTAQQEPHYWCHY